MKEVAKKRQEDKTNINQEETLYIGIDFHKKTSSLCIKDKEGELEERFCVNTCDLITFLTAYVGRSEVALETTGGSNHVASVLKSLGHKVHLVNTNRAKAIGMNHQKTDDKDAEVICDLLRSKFLPEVYIKSDLSREVKTMLVQREFFVQKRVDLMNHIRGVLREYGLPLPTGVSYFYKSAPQAISKVPNDIIRENLELSLEECHKLIKTEERLTENLLNFVEKGEEGFKKRVKQARSVPGIGSLTSILLVAVLDEVSRFPDSHKWGCYLGLTPREFSSGEMRRLGAITRSGCEMLRRYLIHGSRSVMVTLNRKKNKSSLETWAFTKKKKIGMNKATVALAHKMARVAFSVIKEDREFERDYKSPLVFEKKKAS